MQRPKGAMHRPNMRPRLTRAEPKAAPKKPVKFAMRAKADAKQLVQEQLAQASVVEKPTHVIKFDPINPNTSNKYFNSSSCIDTYQDQCTSLNQKF